MVTLLIPFNAVPKMPRTEINDSDNVPPAKRCLTSAQLLIEGGYNPSPDEHYIGVLGGWIKKRLIAGMPFLFMDTRVGNGGRIVFAMSCYDNAQEHYVGLTIDGLAVPDRNIRYFGIKHFVLFPYPVDDPDLQVIIEERYTGKTSMLILNGAIEDQLQDFDRMSGLMISGGIVVFTNYNSVSMEDDKAFGERLGSGCNHVGPLTRCKGLTMYVVQVP